MEIIKYRETDYLSLYTRKETTKPTTFNHTSGSLQFICASTPPTSRTPPIFSYSSSSRLAYFFLPLFCCCCWKIISPIYKKSSARQTHAHATTQQSPCVCVHVIIVKHVNLWRAAQTTTTTALEAAQKKSARPYSTNFIFSISKQKRIFFFLFQALINFCFFFLFCLDNCKSCWIAKGAQCVSSNNKSRLLFFLIRVLRTRAIKVWWCRKKNKWTRQTCAHFFLRVVVHRLHRKKLFDFSSIFWGYGLFPRQIDGQSLMGG